MRALVTGATGFIGSHLCAHLCERGDEVTALVQPTSDSRWLDGLPVRRVEGDLLNGSGLRGAVQGAEVVFHVAGVTRARGRADYHRGNQVTTRNLLAAAREVGAAGKRFLYVSSLSAAGPASPGRPAIETDPPHPITFYGTSKLAAEHEVLACGATGGLSASASDGKDTGGQAASGTRREALPVTIIRPPAVYGPRDRNMISLFRGAARGLFALPSGGRAPVSLVYVTDLVRGLVLAAESPQAVGQTYHISGDVTTWRQVGRILERLLGRRLRCFTVPPLIVRLAGEVGELKWSLTGTPQIMCRRKVKDILQPSWACSDAKARAAPPPGLGYRPHMGLVEGLAETLRWYRENGWL